MAKKVEPGLDDVVLFVDKCVRLARTKDVYVGIDPGATGAIAFLCGNHYVVVDIPTFTLARTRRVAVKKKKGEVLAGPKTRAVHGKTTKFDNVAICKLFKALRPVKDRVHVCLEISQIKGKGGQEGGSNNARTAALSYGGYTMWPLFLCSKGYSAEELNPQSWKKDFALIGKDKEATRRKALQLFPQAPLARKSDHNRAESMLLAETLRRRRGQEKPTGG